MLVINVGRPAILHVSVGQAVAVVEDQAQAAVVQEAVSVDGEEAAGEAVVMFLYLFLELFFFSLIIQTFFSSFFPSNSKLCLHL